ncbi:MAG: 3'-5' exonuclease, partial [Faecalibacterium prausnitzii]
MEAHFLPDDAAETDAQYIADRIEAMVASGEPVRDGGTTRPVQYEDCCVLLAARGDFPAYAEALTARGIPVYADARENLLDAPHIRPLIALLRVIDNPAQDIYLAAAMLGPMFGFTDDDLVRLRAGAQTPTSTPASASTARIAGCAAGRRMTSPAGWALPAPRRPAPDGPERAGGGTAGGDLCLHRLLAALGAMENGQRRREDARRFASFCAGAGAGGISALVRAIDAATLAGSTGQETAPGGARPGCVTIMTIHRSKGLQFPVVFVADTARQFNAADTRQPVLLHRVCGAGLRLRPEGGEGAYKTAAYTALSTVHAAEMRSEQMRLLYVALTRAQDKLILTVPLGIGRTSNPFAKAAAFLAAGAGETLNAQAGSFADWLRAALLVHPNGGPLRRLAGNLELPFADTGSTITLTVQADVLPPEEAPAEAEEPPRPEADPALVETLRQGFGWRYPAAALADIPAKVSVTSLVHAAEQTTLERPGFLSKDGLTAAEMGTALHAFLEHADFGALAAVRDAEDDAVLDAVRAERERQAAAQLTPPAIAGKLDVYKILRFVRSEAFRRICGAEDVLRELAFITSLPAAEVMAAQGRALPDGPAADAGVLVQGIADIVLI